MKEKVAIALVVLSLAAMLSACDMGEGETASKNESLNDISSVISGNIPNNNTDGEYDNDDNNNNDNDDDDNNNNDDNDKDNDSNTLEDDISSIISSGKNVINSMVD